MRIGFAAALVLLCHPVSAQQFAAEGVRIIRPVILANPAGISATSVYMTLVNDGKEAERLVAIETPFGPVTFERPAVDASGTSNDQLAWIDIPPSTMVVLAWGALRGRVDGLVAPLAVGKSIPATLVFRGRGRLAIALSVDPSEVALQPDQTIADFSEDPGAPAAIADALKAALEEDTAAIGPVAVVGDVAVAGWRSGDTGARAFLRKQNDKWRVVLWSGKSLLLPATLTSLGVDRATGDTLRALFRAREVADEALAKLFDAYPGTVVPDF